MAIENETILTKMLNEVHKAKENQHNQDTLLKHIANVKLLCELFLEEDHVAEGSSPSHEEFSQAELKAMIGEQETIKKIQKQQQLKNTQTVDDEEADGFSIFDF